MQIPQQLEKLTTFPPISDLLIDQDRQMSIFYVIFVILRHVAHYHMNATLL